MQCRLRFAIWTSRLWVRASQLPPLHEIQKMFFSITQKVFALRDLKMPGVSGRTTRQDRDLCVLRSRTAMGMRRFTCRGPKAYNELPADLRELPVPLFSRRLRRHLSAQPAAPDWPRDWGLRMCVSCVVFGCLYVCMYEWVSFFSYWPCDILISDERW